MILMKLMRVMAWVQTEKNRITSFLLAFLMTVTMVPAAAFAAEEEDPSEEIIVSVCEVCGAELGKIVHHKIWLDDDNCNDPEISLNPSNFKLECQTCHNKERDPRKTTPGRCLYGPDGEIIRNTEY